jgi:hypothetical protein
LPDPRQEKKSDYPAKVLLWSGMLIFLLGAASRRQFDREADDGSGNFVANLNHLAGSAVGEVPHNKTVADYLEQLRPEYLEGLPPRLVRQLVESRVLDRGRLYGRHLVAIDATGWGSWEYRHCPACLSQTQDGKTTYYHLILEAKVVTPEGLAISVASEFVENHDPDATRQDCELAAFPRLVEKLKRLFPRLSICLLLDSLYANQNVMELCRQYDWDWIITLKKGRLPTVFDEFHRLLLLQAQNVLEHRQAERYQRLAWINDLEHAAHRFSACDCLTYDEDQEIQYFAWITNLPVKSDTVIALANQGGRVRWKIENEGFNVQKNCGYALEHVYSYNPTASKNYYFLLQIAHLFIQLLIKGPLHESFRSGLQTLRNLFKRLAESLRYILIRAEVIALEATRAIQIRLNSS